MEVNAPGLESNEHRILTWFKCSTLERTLERNAILQSGIFRVARDDPAPIVLTAGSKFVQIILLISASKSLIVVIVAPVSTAKLIDAISSKNGDDSNVGV